MTTATWPDTSFVPADLDAADFANIEPLVAALLERNVATPDEFESWLIDRSELEAACRESEGRLYINMTCDTADDGAQSAYTAYITETAPKLKQARFELDKLQHALAQSLTPDPTRYLVLNRDTAADVELFRPENVPLQTELDKLSQTYDQITGKMTVVFQGEERTFPQMARFQDELDRPTRESAWRAVADRRAQDRDAVNDVFDKMIALRNQVAKNADHDSFVGYIFDAHHRFDYTPDDCKAFHDAVADHCVPFARRLATKRADQLGVDPLRPWDLAVDTKGRAPLRPFTNGPDLVAKSRACFQALDPRLAELFQTLGDGANTQGVKTGAQLDLDSRKGKAPGGYQYNLDRLRVPFIFMNAAGLHRDVETMLHEAGHAFHSMLCREDPILHYRDYPIEFAEVASMSMELLTMPHWDAFYPSPDDANRARRQQLENSISLLAWIATIDAFQHWIYTNPDHNRDQRTDFWLGLDERFGLELSWDGLDDARKNQWQRQGHLFGAPLYYIEYGIAQLGALGLWTKSLEEGPAAAITAYTDALSLGGSKPLPDLFAAAGLPFSFGADTIAPIVERVEAELAKLPE